MGAVFDLTMKMVGKAYTPISFTSYLRHAVSAATCPICNKPDMKADVLSLLLFRKCQSRLYMYTNMVLIIQARS